MNFYRKTLEGINTAVEYAVCVLIAAMVVVVFLQVVFRFVIHSSLPWSEELSRYLMVWITFLGASIAVKRKSHIGVEAVVSLFSNVWKKMAAIFVSASLCVFFGFMVLYGEKILRTVKFQLSPAMEITMAIPYSALMTGGFLMLLHSLLQLAENITGKEVRDQ
ncbi:TRAP transporter small permease [Aminivibrio sp.]|jgi:TRAP-type C4-dicarboxylate transport system permease small subunit|uniref:TRAP transporter small permease n=1 Tax=Aminivibrio sp. TaxID=1872489 RepID=UPI001A38F08F|nr:TRAP transporter small permease [Aminivibrio sp.]MBL3539708.1 TRAP transporter small permease [Aminivibrio sp.]